MALLQEVNSPPVHSVPDVDAVLHKLSRRGITLPPGPVSADGYGDSPELSQELIDLIIQGKKRAGTGLLWAIEADGESISSPGTIEIVVDHNDEPALITRLTEVYTVPFNQVTAEYAAIEGEGDGSLEYWTEGHWRFFSRECKRIGREPHPEMPVVCHVFELLQVL